MSQAQLPNHGAGSNLRPLIYTRLATQASWTEHFYDGSCKVVNGRIETYKPNWIDELTAARGFSFEEAEAEPLSAVEDVPTEQPQNSGQEPKAEKKAKTTKKRSRS
jgi:hypothetical protein